MLKPFFQPLRQPPTKQTFRIDEMVRLTSGPFAAFAGRIGGINQAKQLLKVVLQIFDESKIVKAKFSEVVKVPATQRS